MSKDWNMPTRGKTCCACEREFDPGESFNVFLYEAPDGYARRDCCLSCRPADSAPALGSWKTRRPIPATRKVQPFDREAIYAFFQRLDPEDVEKIRFRFVLALMLWRKKVLKFDRTLTEDDREIWRFTVPRAGEVHDVQRPDLDETQIERLSAQLDQLLAGEPGHLDGITADDAHAEEANG